MQGVEIDVKRILHDTLILFVICIVSGLLLGLAYEITYPITSARKAAEKAATYASMFDGADHFEDHTEVIESSVAVLADKGINATIRDCMFAYDTSGNVLGYAYSVVTAGKQAEIVTAVGVQADGTLLGIDILESSETSGLGTKADEPEFKDLFPGRKVSSLKTVKKAASADNEITAISGATVTTNAVVNAVNAALAVSASLN